LKTKPSVQMVDLEVRVVHDDPRLR
jgi:hypothetical protein